MSTTLDPPDHHESASHNDLWTVAGTVTTVWAVVLAVMLAFLSGVEHWLHRQSSWATPTLLVISVALGAVLSFLAGRRRSLEAPLLRVASPDVDAVDAFSTGGDFSYATVDVARIRESRARVIWIVSPHLHYDVYDPQFRQTVKTNKAREAVYRYIVPRTPEIKKTLSAYQEFYNETDSDVETQFLLLPTSKFTLFLTELAIYDAGQAEIYATALPPAGGGHHEDVIVFTRSLGRQYARNFSKVWQDAKGCPP